MTKTYAAIQLLKIEPLSYFAFKDQTGWSYEDCDNVIKELRTTRQIVKLNERYQIKQHRVNTQ